MPGLLYLCIQNFGEYDRTKLCCQEKKHFLSAVDSDAKKLIYLIGKFEMLSTKYETNPKPEFFNDQNQIRQQDNALLESGLIF